MAYDKDELLAMLRRHEGYRDKPYLDSEGILTIGIGHAMGHTPVPEHSRHLPTLDGVMDRSWPKEVLDMLFYNDAAQAESELRVLADRRGVDFDSLSPNRQMALVDMSFNLGVVRLGHFVKMWAALARQDYKDAAKEALDSRWARQVGVRAEELANMIREG